MKTTLEKIQMLTAKRGGYLKRLVKLIEDDRFYTTEYAYLIEQLALIEKEMNK